MGWEIMQFHDREKAFEMTNELEKFRADNLLTDVVLLCEGNELNAHKAVLSAGCMYFRAIFANRLGEEKLELHGMNKIGLEKALRYIYTGRYPTDLESDLNSLKSVLVVADILQLPPLVVYCRQHLVKNLKLENCLEVLDVSMTSLEGDEMQKYAGQHFDKLQFTNTFVQLTLNNLMKLVTCAKPFQSPDVIIWGIIRWAKHDASTRKSDIMSIIDKVDIENLSEECLHVLGKDLFIINESRDFFICLYQAATSRLVKERLIYPKSKPCQDKQCTSSDTCVESCVHVKLDFLSKAKTKLHYAMFTYYYADNLWSEVKNLSKITSTDLLYFLGSGNFIYYFERVANDCKVLYKLHCDANYNECMLFPFERYTLHSAIDFRSGIYAHISNKFVCCDLSCCSWEVLNRDFPNSASTLVTCSNCVWCLCWNQCVIQYVPEAKITLIHDLALTGISGCCAVKCAPSNGSIYFYSEDKHDEKWNVLDCSKIESILLPLPDGIGQLGETWRLCNLKKELPCLFFIDNYNLLWEYYPKKCFWKRVSDDVKFVNDLMAIVVRI